MNGVIRIARHIPVDQTSCAQAFEYCVSLSEIASILGMGSFIPSEIKQQPRQLRQLFWEGVVGGMLLCLLVQAGVPFLHLKIIPFLGVLGNANQSCQIITSGKDTVYILCKRPRLSLDASA